MAIITFDTLKFTQRLEQAGISHDPAVAMAEAQSSRLGCMLFATQLLIQQEKPTMNLNWF
jgi:hypothetical protein